MLETRPLARRRQGPSIYTAISTPGEMALGIRRLGHEALADGPASAHTHEFLVLAYFEAGDGALRIADQSWTVAGGDLYLVAPGEVVATDAPSLLARASGWAAFFPPELLAPHAAGATLAWRTHPLLVPFVRDSGAGVRHLRVPPADRPAWSARLGALAQELAEQRAGYREAALAHLTLVLVAIGRLAAGQTVDLRLKDEPLVSAVFAVIEERYTGPLSLRDVARAVSLSPGHLTTIIRQKTGRTVLEWIAERRLAEARRLLVETDHSIEEIGRAVGYAEAGYFARSFRRAHRTTPVGWRRAGRP